MPEQFVEKLLYGIGVDVDSFMNDSAAISREIKEMGEVAEKTFSRDFGRRLGKAIDPANIPEIKRLKASLASIGPEAQRAFQSSISRQSVKKLFDPFLNEAQTFSGRFKAAMSDAFDVRKVALGAAAGFGLARIGQELLQAGAAAIKFAADFELAITRVQTIAEDDFVPEVMADKIRALSVRIPQDVLTLTAGLGDIIGSGFAQTADALGILEVAAKAATAGFTDTKTAASGIVFILNAFGKSADEAEHVADILFKTVDEGVLSFEDLAIQIGEVASPAAIAGISVEEVAAAIAASTRAGINAAETVTGLKNAILSIIAPADGAAKAAKRLGLDFSAAGIEAAGGFQAFLAQIERLTGGDLKSLEELFPEKRALREIAILAGTMGVEFEKLNAIFTDVGQTAGTMNDAFNLVNGTASKQFDILKNQLSLAAIDFGNSIINFVEPAVRLLNEALSDQSGFEKLIERLKTAGIDTTFLEVENSARQLTEQMGRFNDELDASAQSAANLESILVEGFGHSADERERESEHLIKLAQVEEGRDEISRRIIASQERLAAIRNQINGFEQRGVALGQNQLAALNSTVQKEIDLQVALRNVLKTTEKIEKSREAQNKLADDSRKAASGELQSRKALDDFFAGIEKSTKASAKGAEEAKKELQAWVPELRDITANFKALSDAEQRLFAGIKKVDIRGIFPTANEIRALITQSATEVQAELKLVVVPDIVFNIDDYVKGIEQASLDLRGALFDIATPVNEFVEELQRLGIATDEEFVALADLFDRRFGDLLSSIFTFARSIGSGGTLLGSIIPGIGIISSLGSLFGGAKDNTAQLIKQREAQERAAEAARQAAEALEELRRAAAEFGAGELSDRVEDANDAIDEIVGATERLTDAELERVIAINETLAAIGTTQNEIDQINAQIEEIERRGGIVPQELLDQLSDAQRRMNDLNLALTELGTTTIELTPAEIARIRVLLEEKGILQDAIDAFNAFGDGLGGLIDRLNITFDLRGITDNAEKLALTIAELTKTFEQSADKRLTSALADLPKFIEDGLAALLAGGQTLITFLESVDLEELTAEEFARLLQMLGGFAEDVGDITDTIADEFGKFVDDLNLHFELLDVVDPIEKIKQLIDGMREQFGFFLPLGVTVEQFIEQGLAALDAGGDLLRTFLSSVGLDEFTEDQLREFLLMLEGFGDEIGGATEEIGNKLGALMDRLNLEFDLFDVTDPQEKLRRIREELARTFGAELPLAFDDFIQRAFAAIEQGGDAITTFLAAVGLEELTAEELEALIRTLESIGDDMTDVTDPIVDRFREFINTLNLQFELFDVADPVEKVRMLIEGLHEQFGFIVPLGTTLENFVQQGFDAIIAGGTELEDFLRRVNLEELSREQLEELLRTLEGLGDQFEGTVDTVADALGKLMDRLQLEFELFDVDDPVAQMERLRQEIRKDFGAIIPTTKEGLDRLVREGFAALMAGGDALKAFLASIDLEELTADQFENFLKFLEGLADQIEKKAEEVPGGGGEETGLSIVKQITFQQANVLINEVATIREVVTAILNRMGGSVAEIESGNEELVRMMFEEFDRRIGGPEIFDELAAFHRDFNAFVGQVRDPIRDLAIDIASLLRITPPSFGRLSSEMGFVDQDVVELHQSVDENDRNTHLKLDRLRESIDAASARNLGIIAVLIGEVKALSSAVIVSAGISAFGEAGGTGGATKRFEESQSSALFGLGLTDAGLSRAFGLIAREFDIVGAQNAAILQTLQASIAAPKVAIFIVKDGRVIPGTTADLDESDRRLAEKVVSDMRGSGF